MMSIQHLRGLKRWECAEQEMLLALLTKALRSPRRRRDNEVLASVIVIDNFIFHFLPFPLSSWIQSRGELYADFLFLGNLTL